MSQLLPLIKTALLGTQREPLPEPSAGTPLADLIQSLNGVEPEAMLLSLAGAQRLSELAGQLPRRAPVLSAASLPPAGDTPPCGAAAKQQLAAMLAGRFQSVLPEFLTGLVRAGRRAPNELLPALLDHGVKGAALRSLILPALGQTGRWLAAQNPAWSYASPEAETWDGLVKMWRSGNADQRGGLLIQLRATRPEWGLALANTTWKTERPLARNKLVRTLEIGLSAADEPFLEAALDDRDLSIRRTASDLLAQIPNSRLMQRMTAYAPDVLGWSPDEHPPITINMPEPIPPEMIRDGVLPTTAGLASNVRRARISVILGAIPLGHWEAAWGASPEVIVQAALASAWPRTVIRGFILAAARQRNADWARALLIGDSYSADTIRLASLLPPQELEWMICSADQSGQSLDGGLMVRLLHQRGSPWRIDVAQRWIDALARHIRQPGASKPPGMILRMVVKAFGRCCPVTLADEAASALLPVIRPESVWWSMVQEAIAMLRFPKPCWRISRVDLTRYFSCNPFHIGMGRRTYLRGTTISILRAHGAAVRRRGFLSWSDRYRYRPPNWRSRPGPFRPT
jgi:hypothetical protein